jgi:hypothetical protein
MVSYARKRRPSAPRSAAGWNSSRRQPAPPLLHLPPMLKADGRNRLAQWTTAAGPHLLGHSHDGRCRGFVNRCAIEVGVWQFAEGGEHEGAIQDGGSTSLPSFRSRDGGEIPRAAIIHYMAISARLQWWGWLFRYAIGRMTRTSQLLPQGLLHAGLIKAPGVGYTLVPERIQLGVLD